ncbi:MFS transporter [Rhodovulum sp. DZ06]|uniref:MFS transporter n=1 Tax=Rhodovulum sp. DZ06 TaxID=3425126 RepID=UPI003D351FAB
MLDLFSDRTYAKLFAAQLVSLLGAGIASIALALKAFDLAGDRAGIALGTILTIKMIAYVFLAPVAGALAERLPRRAMLAALDAWRAGCALLLPFADEMWEVYALIFALQAGSAAFTPAFQATIPDVLPDEARYTRALSLSRLAYDLENIVSPLLAGILLALISADALFFGTALGFAGSGALVLACALPRPGAGAEGEAGEAPRQAPFRVRLTRGVRIYLATPRLRGLLAVNMAAAATGAMVLINTAPIVRGVLGMDEQAVAWALGAFGTGSMVAALALPRVLERVGDRPVMLLGGGLAVAALLGCAGASGLGGGAPGWAALLALWGLVGVGYSAALTPSGRLLRRSGHPADRPALFAAQFALSHACWLLAYPLSGWLMTEAGAGAAALVLAGLGVAGLGVALAVWPAGDPDEPEHEHPELPPDHPHLRAHGRGAHHHHPVIIDHLHPHWPEKRH